MIWPGQSLNLARAFTLASFAIRTFTISAALRLAAAALLFADRTARTRAVVAGIALLTIPVTGQFSGVAGFDFTDLPGLRAGIAVREVDVAKSAAPATSEEGLELAVSGAIYRTDAVTRRDARGISSAARA